MSYPLKSTLTMNQDNVPTGRFIRNTISSLRRKRKDARRRRRRRSRYATIARKLRNIDNARASELARAFAMAASPSEESLVSWQGLIEGERSTLLGNNDLLIDGRHGDGGLYDEGVTVSDACNVSEELIHATLLYHVTKSIGPANVIELGTNVGISSAYIAAGVIDSKATDGYVKTLDASRYRQDIAKQVHSNVAISNVQYVPGLFADTLKDTLEDMRVVELAFIDGHHQYQPTLDYLDQIYTYSASGAVFVFDDIDWSDGMRKAWAELAEDERFDLVIDVRRIGICVRGDSRPSQRHILHYS